MGDADAGARARNGGRAALGAHRAALYGQRQDYGGMVGTARAMVDGAGARINALVLRSDDLAGALGDWTPRRYAMETRDLGAKTVLSLERRGARQGAASAARIQVAIAEMPDGPNHYCAVSDCRSGEFKGVFMKFVSKYTPEISRLFLTNEDMAGILGGIESRGYDVRVRYGSARGFGRATGEHESSSTSTSVPPAAYFDGLARGSRAAMTVRYEARPSGGGGSAPAELRGAIARDCRFSASAGAGIIFETMIPRALSLPLERNRRIEESAESAGSGDDVEPTVIRFDWDIFADARKNGRYVDMIANMPDSSISKYHINSHIHLSLVDYTDGSSYDI